MQVRALKHNGVYRAANQRANNKKKRWAVWWPPRHAAVPWVGDCILMRFQV